MLACSSFCNSQEKFPKAQVDIYITVLENDGNGQSVGMTTAFCCTKVQESVVGSVNAKMSWNGQNDFQIMVIYTTWYLLLDREHSLCSSGSIVNKQSKN